LPDKLHDCEIFQCETSFAELQVEAKSAAKNKSKQNVEQKQMHREKARKCLLMLFVL